ncbi:protein mono-ADP-ribosyltransferase PARP14-like isoform X3 [Synchiropus splendidus]|uniref:protein mono-ADP-ribosyltransferase PARP14-like isoform X3 n=1 Tax=Synchiropus splendidus TaxID=270530 RepID=UPI00237DE2FB|nr:protein mono-ADP-ribosyltransferase PARP14-like isoform X3 [Synchiropus splendidus]
MSGSGFPVVVAGVWTSAQTKSVKNKLLVYFQSNKKSSGGECQVELEESSPRAVVVFSSEEVRDRVLARENHEITVCNHTIKLQLSSATCQASQDNKTETVAVVLENISDMSRELLTMLVENISGLECGDYHVETIFEVNKAVVTFNNAADTLSFISKSEKSKKLEKRRVTAWPLGAAKSIRVENLPPTASHDILELFFEKSLAGPEEITLIPEEQAAVLTFSDSKVLRNLKRDYKINATPVKVYPYYQSLGTALYGKDRPTWEMPEPFTEKVHHVIYKFLVKKNLVNTINERMRPHYCSVDMGQAEVTLRPVPNFLRQSGLTQTQVEGWKSDALSAFRRQMAEFSAFECPANEAAWREAQKTVLSVLKEDGFPVMDTSRGVLTVAGHADSMKQIRATVEDIIKTEMSCVERKTNGLKEVIDLAPAVFYTVMEGGLQKKIATAFPELKLVYADDSHKLSIEGFPTEVYQTKSWIYEMIHNISRKPLNLPSHILEFLTTIDVNDLSSDLFTSHEIRAFLRVENSQAVLVGAGEQMIQDAESKMKSDLHCRTLDVEDAEVLKLQDWKDLLKDLLETYNSPKKQTCQASQDNKTGSPDTASLNAESQIPVEENPKAQIPVSPQPPNPTPQDGTPAPAAAADEEVETVAVVLENISDMSRELLTMLVENISGLECGDYHVETIFEVNKAVVTFNNAADTLSFISKSEKSKKLEKRRVTAWPLGAAKSIRVENLPPTASHDILELFFEKSLAGPEEITLIPEEQAAVLTFSDSKVLRNLKRDYKINATPVKVYPYYQSLGTALYGKDRPTWEMPEPFTEKVHHVIYKFLVKKNLVNTINERMRPHYCSVDMGQAEVTLRPVPNFLRQSGLTQTQVEGWKSDALSAFRRQMAEFSAFECPANEAAWREAQKTVLSVLKEDGFPVMDTSRGVLTVAGHADSMKQIRATVEDIIKTEMSCVERKTNGLKEVIDLAPAVFYTVMEGGLQKKIATAFPELKLVYADDSHKLSIEGFPTEVYQTKSWIYEMIHNISRKPLNLPSHILEFLTTIDVNDLSRDLFTSHEIRAFLRVENSQAVLVGVGEQMIQDAESKMKSDLHCRTLDVEDAEVLKLQDWKDLLKDLLETYNSPKKQTVGIMVHLEREDKVTVAGFRSPVNEASDHLQKFLSSRPRVKESLRVKSCAVVLFIEKHSSKMWATLYRDSDVAVKFKAEQRKILLEGFHLNVQSVKSELEKLAEGLFCDSLVLDKPGAKKHCQKYAQMFLPSLWTDFNCAVMLQPDQQEEEEEGEEAPQVSEGTLVRFCQVSTADGVLVSVARGDICSMSVDAIVNSANEHLYHIGGLALAILHAAGPRLQDICNDYIAKHGKLQPGDAITTDPCNLPCKHVVHAVGPRFSQSDRKTSVSCLKLVVKRSLQQAEKNRCKTVALPAISSGILGFPVDLCAQTIAQAVREFCDRADGPISLAEIYLVDNTHDTVKALAAAVNSEFSDLHPVMMRPLEEERRGPGSSSALKAKMFSECLHRREHRDFGGRRNQPVQHGKADTFSSLFGMSEKDSSSPKQLVVKREEFEPAVFQLCADSHKALTQAKKKIEGLIVDEQATKTIDDWYIGQLASEDVSQLEALQREMTVRIRLDKGTEEQIPHIHLEGLTRDVASAESTIRELLRKVERQDNLRSKAKLMANLVEWKYEDGTGALAVFDIFTNLELEEALKKQRTVRVKFNGKEYDVDAVNKKAISTRGQNPVELFRRDLKDEPDLPSNWGDMNDDLVKLFPLTPEDQEYQDLDKKLKAEKFTGKITRIERVQNRTLWQSYQLLKKELEQKNKHQNNELVLYHGTQSDAIALINKQGFNRSYAGMHGALYGNGCYFAVDPMYSYNYAKPDGRNDRRMYAARVLVGDFTKGAKGMISPPSRNTGQAADLFDSVVDKEPNPAIHVIFQDIQAYPEYLLTFT